jgi:hypothetical protein
MLDVSEDPTNVINCDEPRQQELQQLLQPYGLNIETVAIKNTIPGSFFGDREAGLIANTLYLRHDTPIHSALHEACHYICMCPKRRAKIDTNAEGDYDEENAVCYLQILLADHLSNFGQQRIMIDMDRWGYTFRLGSAKAWFQQDAEDAKYWLQSYNIIDIDEVVTFKLRLD